MEEILDLYQQPYDPKRPLVCLDQLTIEVREPIPMEPGSPERYDTQYERNGVSNIFMIFEPLAGWRHVEVTDRRTAVDWAHQVKELVDGRYRGADKIVLVQDNLNTHIRQPPFIKPLALKRRTGSQASLNFITHQNTAVGLIWLK